MTTQKVVDIQNDPLPAKVKVPDTTVDLRRPWEYRSAFAGKETQKAYLRFEYYLSLGGKRTLSNVADHFSVALPIISVQAKKGQWRTRAAAFDEFEALRKAEEEREERHNSHLEKLKSFRERSEQLGMGLIGAGAQLLSIANASIAEMKSKNETLDRRLIASSLNASAKVAECGRILMAQSLGVDALLTGVDGADGDGDEFT